MKTEKHRIKTHRERADDNRDPISGAAGAHPLGTGVGAAAGGIAGAAVAAAVTGGVTGTAIAGPAGTVTGTAIGAIVGGLAGKSVAENVNPTAEDAYWREQHRREPYYDKNYSYQDYQGAYRTGYEGYRRWGAQGKRYEDIEPELRREYEKNYPKSKLSWDKARPAARAAWSRFGRNLGQYIGYAVIDRNNSKIGTLECLWSDHDGEPAFVGVRTGWIFGRNHVVPAQSVTLSERHQRIRLPYEKERVKDAPTLKADSEMSSAKEAEVCNYYGVVGTAETPSSQIMANPPLASQPPAEASSGEQTQSGNPPPQTGVRLRKIVRLEIGDQPVEIQREETVGEPTPESSSVQSEPIAASTEEDYVPLRREKSAAEKEARSRAEIQAREEKPLEEPNISQNLRRENTGQTDNRQSRRTPAEEIRDREQVPRSRRKRE